MLQEYVWNQGNGWQVTIEELGRYFERVQGLTLPDVAPDQPQAWIDRRRDAPPPEVAEAVRTYLAVAEVLGRRTGELHVQPGETPGRRMPPSYPNRQRRPTSRRRPTPCGGMPTSSWPRSNAPLPRLDERRRELGREVLAHRDRLTQPVRRPRASARGRRAYPMPRRLPPRTGAGHGRRRRHPRLRGRAGAAARRAADEDLAAPRRRGHAALVQLRGTHRASGPAPMYGPKTSSGCRPGRTCGKRG